MDCTFGEQSAARNRLKEGKKGWVSFGGGTGPKQGEQRLRSKKSLKGAAIKLQTSNGINEE